MTADLRGIEQLLADRMGLDPRSVGSPLILRAVRQRMSQLRLDDIDMYKRALHQSESELQWLIERVVIPESWFFRDERPYDYFCKHIRQCWLNDLSRPPLRVLSLACAGGEEPYSIAMALRDLELSPHRFGIDAVDISARHVGIAHRGVYSLNAFRGPELSYREKYFHEHLVGYELDSSIRSKVRFFQGSAADCRLLDKSAPYDVVFCRNLLIYLNVAARQSVVVNLKRLLATDGLVFIGHADRLEIPGQEAQFVAEGDPACFAYRLRQQRDSVILAQPGPAPLRAMPSEPDRTALVPLPDGTAGNVSSDLPSAACNVTSTSDEQSLLDQAAVFANEGRFSDAIAACEQHLRLKGYSASVYYLMGMIWQAMGDRAPSEDCFRKAVYLDPAHDEALLALALLAERRGDHNAAAGFRRRAERSLNMSAKRVN